MESMGLADFYKGKKVFLTGHTGFKGTWLVNILKFFGSQITGYALEPPTKPSLFEIAKTSEKIRSIYGDIRDFSSLLTAMQTSEPEIVIHLAAQPIVRESYKNPKETFETNVMGTVNVLEALRKTPSVKSFVNVTTDKVYKNKEWLWGYRETEELCGLDPYSNSKSCSELVTYSYKKSFFENASDLRISTARSGNVIGGGDFAPDRIIPDCIRYAREKGEIIVRNPFSIRPYQHVLECLYGYLLLAKKQFENKDFEGAYNFGPESKDCISTGQLVDIFCKSWGGNLKWKKFNEENAPHEASFLKLDNSKAKSLLGWFPKWSIETAVKKVVEWERGCSIEKQIEEFFLGV